MKIIKNKKIAAALAGVTAVISSEEQAMLKAEEEKIAALRNNSPGSITINLWGISGRQAIMNANSFVQQRLYK